MTDNGSPPLPALLLQRALVALRTSMNQPTDQTPVWEGKIRKLDLRFYPSMFYIQFAIVAVALVYFVFALLGRMVNRWRASAWLRTLEKVLPSEFAHIGDTEAKNRTVVWNGGDEASIYATGRRGVSRLHAKVRLAPRHDPATLTVFGLYDRFGLPLIPTLAGDRAVLTFELPHSRTVGTFAIIDKVALQRVRHGRFDLSFARVADGANFNSQRGLDERFAVASECADITDKWLGEIGARGDSQRAALGLVEKLNSRAGTWLESLVWTDQPAKRPEAPIPAAARLERLELTLRLPRTAAQAEEALPLVAAALDIVDALEGAATGRNKLIALRPETHTALRRTRADVDAELDALRQRDERLDKEEAEEAKRLEEQRSKLEKLTPAEQERRKQIEKKRALRKAQGASGVRVRK
ncbi:hypothetical protein MCUN1_003894 [Malassezia cuniculi]|uniref:Uncharacterized protein n=1 Tax=Malassezia cuniculi TaxID=948313 RepID=A0AAF0J7U5_9BASI|nr:hypothetical protein MCUN1_003894 [Malassezia cuniculi]